APFAANRDARWMLAEQQEAGRTFAADLVDEPALERQRRVEIHAAEQVRLQYPRRQVADGGRGRQHHADTRRGDVSSFTVERFTAILALPGSRTNTACRCPAVKFTRAWEANPLLRWASISSA